MKVVVDTNVLVSAALRDRLPERLLLSLARDATIEWCATKELLGEYEDVLARPKFGLDPATLEVWHDRFTRGVSVVSSSGPQLDFPRDPKDLPAIVSAISSGAHYLLTGDKDFVEAVTLIAPTCIVSVAEMAGILGII